ncbi:hypothetical protein BG000_006137, partial [Podila horticola]
MSKSCTWPQLSSIIPTSSSVILMGDTRTVVDTMVDTMVDSVVKEDTSRVPLPAVKEVVAIAVIKNITAEVNVAKEKGAAMELNEESLIEDNGIKN